MMEIDSRVRILMINDDALMSETLSAFLRSRGYDVFEGNQDMDGIGMATSSNPDLILLDMQVAGMDGQKICRRIRESSPIPILILSALDEPGKVASMLDAGADDYLTKPVTNSMLIARLNTLTRRLQRDGRPFPQQSAAGGRSHPE